MNHVFVAGLKLAYRVFKLIDTLNRSLQRVAMNSADDREVAMAAVKLLKDRRTEEVDKTSQDLLEKSEQMVGV